MRIIVYEHMAGGGYAKQPLPPSIICEGYGMLRSLAADLKAAGHEVTVLLDERISKLNPPLDADYTVPIVDSAEPTRFLCSIAQINDAAYVIAPETAQTLKSLVSAVEQTGKVSLNSEADAITKAADKAVLYEKLLNLGLAPKTVTLNIDEAPAKAASTIKKELGYPAVVKPADGVSCSSLSIVENEAQTTKAIAKIKAKSPSKLFIAQQYIAGQAASVSLLSTGKKATALSLNKQNLTLEGPEGDSSYLGGVVPFMHPLKEAAFAAAKKAVESIAGLRGYVGVDLVMAEDRVFVLDVNARLTTSYVGLRRVAGFNVAEAMVDAVLHEKLPKTSNPSGFACFSKVETPKPTNNAFHKAAKLPSVVSPPFLLNGTACSLLMGEGATLAEADLQLEQAKKRLLTITG